MRLATTPFAPFLLAAWILAASGCGSARTGTVATVNGEPMTSDDFDRFVRAELGELSEEPLGDAVRSELFDEFLKRTVTAQEARGRGLALEPSELAAAPGAEEPIRAEVATELLVLKYYREVVLRDVEVTPAEVAGYYEENRELYSRANGYYAREIRVGTFEEAERLRREIASGRSDFATVARASSKAPTARRGGLAFYEKGQLPPVLERAVAPLALGTMSPVVRSSFGHHLFLLEARGAALPLERVRGEIAEELRARKSGRLVEADAERLLGRASVAIESAHLRFHYGGRFAK